MERRNYLKLLALGGMATTLNFNHLIAQSNPNKIKAETLKIGDEVAIIAPSTAVSSPDDIEKAKEIVKHLGLIPVFGKNVINGSGYKTRTIKERIEDIHWAFADSNIKAVFCIRGGYGSGSLLPYLNYELIKKNPKIFCGYSDITAMHLAISKMTGLVTFHGPVMLSSFDNLTIKSFKELLFENKLSTIQNPDNKEIRNPFKTHTIVKGESEGELVGGNLSLICSLMGTEFEIETDNKILFIEDVGEEPYKLHRMLTQLKNAKKFDKLKGIVIGLCNDCSKTSSNTWDMSEIEVYFDLLSNYNYPIFYGLLIGHTKTQFTLPLNINYAINSNNNSLNIIENALVK